VLRALFSKLKLLYEIVRATVRRKRLPVVLYRSDVRFPHSVRFLGESSPIVVTLVCYKHEYYHHNGRFYKPSGIYKDWVMCYQDPTTPIALELEAVVYPNAHNFNAIINHYVDYLGTTSLKESKLS